MPLANKYCKGKGIEIGAAAHNPFNLENCINIAPKEDEAFYKQSQEDMCGYSVDIDFYGYANDMPVEGNSYDYIISSHVLEHVHDPIGAFKEWDRVVKDNGIIFIIVPKRDALPSDKGRPLPNLSDFMAAHNNPGVNNSEGFSNHIWVFSLPLLVELVTFFNKEYKKNWEILETEETDSKVGNGHTIVCRVNK